MELNEFRWVYSDLYNALAVLFHNYVNNGISHSCFKTVLDEIVQTYQLDVYQLMYDLAKVDNTSYPLIANPIIGYDITGQPRFAGSKSRE